MWFLLFSFSIRCRFRVLSEDSKPVDAAAGGRGCSEDPQVRVGKVDMATNIIESYTRFRHVGRASHRNGKGAPIITLTPVDANQMPPKTKVPPGAAYRAQVISANEAKRIF